MSIKEYLLKGEHNEVPGDIGDLLVVGGCGMRSGNRTAESSSPAKDTMTSVQMTTTEIGCAMCIYNMEGVAGCTPAVVVDGQPRLMTGVDMDLHAYGLCTAPRQAVVSGRLEGQTFLARTVNVQ